MLCCVVLFISIFKKSAEHNNRYVNVLKTVQVNKKVGSTTAMSSLDVPCKQLIRSYKQPFVSFYRRDDVSLMIYCVIQTF